MLELKMQVRAKVGLHARPAALLVQTANKFTSNITIQNLSTHGETVDAKSILMVLALGVLQYHEILIQVEGSDEQQAVQCLSGLMQTNFGEDVN